MTGPLLAIAGLSKSFCGVPALRAVQLQVLPGEVHALLGENGAGKSTLMKCVSGALQPDAGTMHWLGRPHRPRTPAEALRAGIHLIYQEFNLVPGLSISENVCLGREPRRGRLFCARDRARALTQAALARLGLDLDPDRRVGTLSVAEQQLVEISKALVHECRLLAMDEPTATLTPRETERLFAVVRELRDRGVGVIYITHRLEEVERICDRATILRDGAWVSTDPVAAVTRATIIARMVGRELGTGYPQRPPCTGPVLLELCGLTRAGQYDAISLTLGEGEMLGLFGLVGSGRTELALGLIGSPPAERGRMLLRGTAVAPRNPRHARALGLGLLSEDRARSGIVPERSVRENVLLGAGVPARHERQVYERLAQQLRIRTPSPRTRIAELSGGNQQKALLARLLASDAEILIVDEPTRGIDVGAKAEIHEALHRLTAAGKAVLLISSELPEILGMADRIAVLARGRLTGVLTRAAATREAVMELAIPG